jgi:hypothetical protein
VGYEGAKEGMIVQKPPCKCGLLFFKSVVGKRKKVGAFG